MPEANRERLQPSRENTGARLDRFLVSQLPETSRARVQELILQAKVLVNGRAEKASYRLRGDEQIQITGEVKRTPLRAIPEEIPLDIVFEDDDLAVVNKPAGMMVHAGAGATDDARNRGTLVNALLHHFGSLSKVGGEMRPGIVHRLDKETSGLIIVAKNDAAHGALAKQFSNRRVKKTYIALIHGWMKKDRSTIDSPIHRDAVRRTRMTTRRSGGREALTRYEVQRRIESIFGKFTLLRVEIATGRTHQIRVHLASVGHPVVGGTIYGASAELRAENTKPRSLQRNFLHAAELQFEHPRTHQVLDFERPLPPELEEFMSDLLTPEVPAKRL